MSTHVSNKSHPLCHSKTINAPRREPQRQGQKDEGQVVDGRAIQIQGFGVGRGGGGFGRLFLLLGLLLLEAREDEGGQAVRAAPVCD